MTNIVLCTNEPGIEYAHVFPVSAGETITILSSSPYFSDQDLDNASDFIRMNHMEADIPGYYEDWDYNDDDADQNSVYSPNGGSGPVFDMEIFSNPKTLRLSRADVLAYVSAGQFLQPYLYRGTVYVITDDWGETYYATEYPAEENAENIDTLDGFLPYVAANGYLDRVDLGFYETEAEAIEALIDYYCE